MKQHSFNTAAGVVFLVVALVHLARAIQGWSAVFNGWTVPVWASWVGVVVAGYLSLQAFQLNK